MTDSTGSKMEQYEVRDLEDPSLSRLESQSKDHYSCHFGYSWLYHRAKRPSRKILAFSIFILLILCVRGGLLVSGYHPRLIPANGLRLPKPGPITEAPLLHGNPTLLKTGKAYVKAIMNASDTHFPRLDCPAPTPNRYNYLRNGSEPSHTATGLPKYFFALDLHQCIEVLPRLIGSIVETIRFLGPENCALSVVEGRSTDGTYEVLKLLQDEMDRIGTRYFFTPSDIDPETDHRIEALAKLRNLALQPLVDHSKEYDPEVAVIFLNDVAICMEDILELIHQRKFQEADVACAMDWVCTFRSFRQFCYSSCLSSKRIHPCRPM